MACGSVRGSVGGMPNVAPWLIGSGLAFGCLLMSLRALRRQRLLEDMPTSKTTGVERVEAALRVCMETFGQHRSLAKILLVQALG